MESPEKLIKINFLDIARVRTIAIFVDNMGEKTDSVRKKLAFVEIEDHASFVEIGI
jgi:hypothetical protein